MTENNLSLIPIKGQVNLALQKAELSIQTIINLESGLVYNEDNLQQISDFVSKAKKAKDIIEEEHKRLKQPYLEQCRIFDESKRNMIGEIDQVLNRAIVHYQTTSRNITERANKLKLDQERKNRILGNIAAVKSDFASKIAAADTYDRIAYLERLLNLESGNERKYEEFLPLFKSTIENLRGLIKERKSVVDELSKQNKAEFEAMNDMEQLEESMVTKELLEHQLKENSLTIVEDATNVRQYPLDAEEMIPTVPKPKRTTWEWVITDMKVYEKHHPDHIIKEVNKKVIDANMKAMKELGEFDGKNEVIKPGIRYYAKYTY